MKIIRDNDNLIVTIPLKARRFNPYNDMAGEDHDTGEMDNIVGVVESRYEDGNDWEDIGFMYLQDMDYKGKDDQLTDWAIMYHGSKEDFEKLCGELKIPLWRI